MTYNHTFEDILGKAKTAAVVAVRDMGPEDRCALDCGFAWVTIGGNEPLARYCRKRMAETNDKHARFYGRKGYPKGWTFWNPGEFAGQAVGHILAGATAFMQVLGEYNIRATVSSRLD